jgi:hypothetical protein
MILDTTRHPRLAHQDEEQHTYEDKFALAEFLVNTSIAAKMNALERLGLTSERLQQVSNTWVHKEQQSVTLRLQAEDTCVFVKDRMVDLPSSQNRTTTETTVTTSNSSSFLGMGGGGSPSTKTETVKNSHVSTKVKEHHWKVGVRYRLILFKGTTTTESSDDSAVELQSRSASTILITSGGSGSGRPISPMAERTVHVPIDVPLTWFFQRISPTEQLCEFIIDRDQKSCKTPRRNDNVDAAVEFDRKLHEWTRKVAAFFMERVEGTIANKPHPVGIVPTSEMASEGPKHFSVGSTATIVGLQKEPTFNGKQVTVVEYLFDQHRYRVDPVDPTAGLPHTLLIKPQNLQGSKQQEHTTPSSSPTTAPPPLTELDDEAIFAPVLPLLEKGEVLSRNDVADFLNEQTRSMDEAIDNLNKMYPPRQLMKLVSVAEATLVVLCQHMQRLSNQCSEGLDYIEEMLKRQLIQAIGQEVGNKEFETYMRFREQQVFRADYAPTPFSYAVRRPNHFPEGMISIETTTTTTTQPDTMESEPIETWVRRITGGPPIHLPISAATVVQLGGDICLHGWMQHRFKSRAQMRPSFQLVARARQFSSFLLLVGTIAGPDNRFEPKDAIILQNKDQVLIPLLTHLLPSTKEFKDAIASLSPEQQEFAKAFRTMQLESSVFAVCVIQLKPQLERLLGLPQGSLTKEIQLTQDLMSLFVDYQIPSDLLSFEGSGGEALAAADKVAAVKGYVKTVLDVIDGEKMKQLKKEELKADMNIEMAIAATAIAVGVHPAPPGYIETEMLQDESERSATGGSFRGSKKGLMMRKGSKKKLHAPPAGMVAAPQAARNGRRLSAPASSQEVHLPPRSPRPVKQRQMLIPPLPFRTESVKQPTSDGKPAEGGRELISPNGGGEDFTNIPKLLDAKLEQFDKDDALRSTIIKASQNWTRLRQENLLTPVSSEGLTASDIGTEKRKAFDLLDAISRSGTLPIDCAELHVVVALSHCFENDVM